MEVETQGSWGALGIFGDFPMDVLGRIWVPLCVSGVSMRGPFDVLEMYQSRATGKSGVTWWEAIRSNG